MGAHFINWIIISLWAGSSALIVTPVTDPVISKVGDNVTLEIKPPGILGSVTWTFSPTGIPVVQWNGPVPVTGPGYENRVTLNTTTGSLELRSVQLSDAGEYIFEGITITSGRETFNGSVTVKVYEPVSQPRVRSNVTNPVEFNDTVSLTCTASGSAVSYRWLNGSSVLSDSERIHLSDDNKTLTIPRVLRSDDGTLYCYVFNPVTNSTSEPFHLIVSYGPESLTLSISPQKLIYSAGLDLTLSCSAQSSPPAHYQWYFNGAPLNKLGSQLNMAHIQHSQTGNYTCWASNNITLRYADVTRAIIVVESITNVNVKPNPAQPIANQTLNLTCEVLGSQTVSSRLWLKNNQPLSTSDRITLSVDNSTVSFNPVLQSDNGTYQCKAENPVSEVTSVGYRLFNSSLAAGNKSLTAGQITGIVIGTLVGVVLIGVGVYFSVKTFGNGTKTPKPSPPGPTTAANANDKADNIHYADPKFLKNNKSGQRIQMEQTTTEYAQVAGRRAGNQRRFLTCPSTSQPFRRLTPNPGPPKPSPSPSPSPSPNPGRGHGVGDRLTEMNISTCVPRVKIKIHSL
ncbi:carcinoembryonic antigen-related cell adhesion molecule 1-like [Polyodon spathula]|uniref:carcinoembryonic antigen-related cell adhesion molecule 1-like n=1 Tax=Polyodon spathula TaxID=7913 RepID=UPI001B7EBFB3|nr:carcinoembryonic antigen-related cell adhesion molecule 1-like [Polyodon spathula]